MKELERRLQANMYMSKYLLMLERLLSKKVDKNELLSAEETEKIRQHSIKTWVQYPEQIFEISFEERTSQKFKNFIDALAKAAPAKFYLWISHVRACGLSKPVNLLDINFSFEFDWIEGDVFSISSIDGENLLDFDLTDDDGEKTLEILYQGKDWQHIRY